MTAARAARRGRGCKSGKAAARREQGRPKRKPAADAEPPHNAEAANPAPRPHPRREGAGDAGQGAADAAGGGRRAPRTAQRGAVRKRRGRSRRAAARPSRQSAAASYGVWPEPWRRPNKRRKVPPEALRGRGGRFLRRTSPVRYALGSAAAQRMRAAALADAGGYRGRSPLCGTIFQAAPT